MINLIVAHGEHREIGFENKLLWKLPKDMDRFVELTTGHTVVMGRKTYESIGRPLPNRENIVLTRDPEPVFLPQGVAPFDSTDSILRYSKDREIFIIGGAEVYKAFLPYADRLYITLVRGTFKADTYFPEYTHLLDNYVLGKRADIQADEKNEYGMKFLTFEKIR